MTPSDKSIVSSEVLSPFRRQLPFSVESWPVAFCFSDLLSLISRSSVVSKRSVEDPKLLNKGA